MEATSSGLGSTLSRAGPLACALLPPALTNHQGRGLEVGVKGTTTLAILQKDTARLVSSQSEVRHALQRSDRWLKGLSGKEECTQGKGDSTCRQVR